MHSTQFLISPSWKGKMQDNRYVIITNGAVCLMNEYVYS